MLTTLKYILPFSYTYFSRLQQTKEKAIVLFYEFIPNILILYYLVNPGTTSIFYYFGFAYLSFISVYELGYLANDVHSVRHETDPRKRITDFNPSNFQLFIWVTARIATFLFFSYQLNVLFELKWWLFYAILVCYFALHNIFKDKYLKVFTFFHLAILRFMAPIFFFLSKEQFLLIVPSVIVYYVLFRTLSYMDSKNLLNLPERKTDKFRLLYYMVFIGIGLFFWFMANSKIPLFFNLYFIIINVFLTAVYRFYKKSA